MKVKVGQLKAHLSQYLREMEASGEPIEVCVRERPVAYLTPIMEKDNHAESGPPPELVKSLAANGIRIVQWGGEDDDFVPTPRPAGDGKQIENSVVAMREEKDW
ncbi:MAG: type II toxin-antitoxin system prevent-host-death family antitoxin [Verrucomicrobia bacterium]|nr:type II toxin-antitoxin system prevent-host-death family antitoxin [Verrucomicrobiota bacterium]MCH8513913.1 type II toxin-antitoxin system prevent-host-death family antitoxin [Kiritimatiellia bacterium]